MNSIRPLFRQQPVAGFPRTGDRYVGKTIQLVLLDHIEGGLIVCVWASRLAQLNQSPPMRQQLRNLTCPLRRQTREHVLQIGVRVMPVESS